MKPGDRVSFQTGLNCYGIGYVISYDEEKEIIKVRDEDDNSVWTGPVDKCEPADDL
ncbi:MAG TPA: hypothetical protein VEC35_16360 [Noviherbaspirillum sp.]|nr:hypothetical protein [Noviherbaspirillum sp.]